MGTVSVSLSSLEGELVELIVSDDGKGLPPEIDIENSPSLGLQLAVATVTRELGGSIKVMRNGGTRFVIRFECKSQ
jgi:two-component sensor histidine kinase